MKNQLFRLLFCILFLVGCKEDYTPTIKSPETNSNYAFFPLKDGYEWNYEMTSVDFILNKTIKRNQLTKYSLDSQRLNNYYDGILWSYSYWKNQNNLLKCCVNTILLDYSQIGCTADSVLIQHVKKEDYTISNYQFCDKILPSEVSDYSKVYCIKTTQINAYADGSEIHIKRYFGFDVGLVFEQQTYLDELGNTVKQETQKLVSHNF